jgi:glycosyltransferase involved in cell wall biosynthesis
MRILYLTNNPNLGSTIRVFLDWFLLGREEGIESFVAVQRKGHLIPWLTEKSFDFCLNPMPWPNRKWPMPSLWQAWKLARWAKKRRIDLIHCAEHDVYPFASLVRLFYRCPLIVHCQFLIGREFAQWAFGGNRMPAALIWTASSQREDCAEAFKDVVPPERQYVLPMGVNLEKYGQLSHERDAFRQKLGIRQDQVVVGTASQICARKRIHEFVELIKRLAATNPQVVGLIAGGAFPCNEPYLRDIQSQIEASGLGNRLRWLNRLEPLEPFLHALDVFVSASEYETFGMSVCEAMACRRAVAAYRGGSVGEVVGDAGVVVETGDFEGLCAGVERLVNDAALREKLGNDARQRVADCFDPAISFQEMKAIYQSVLTTGRSPSIQKDEQPIFVG